MISRLITQIKNRRRERARLINLAAIEKMGLKALQVNAAYQAPRYHLQDVSGKIYDNGGAGFRSSQEARAAAEQLLNH